MLLMPKEEFAILALNAIPILESSGVRVYEVPYTLCTDPSESVFENHQLLLSKRTLSH